jgi:hypothetical protein
MGGHPCTLRDAHRALQQTMADARKPNPTRRVRQIAGPLEGYRLGASDIPVRIFDLTNDRCVVEMSVESPSGTDIRLQIDLPGEGWTVIRGDTIHIAGHDTLAVTFSELDETTRNRIGRAIDRQLDRPTEHDATVIDGETNDD